MSSLARLAICCWISAASWLWFVAEIADSPDEPEEPAVVPSKLARRFVAWEDEPPASWQSEDPPAASWERSVLGDLSRQATSRLTAERAAWPLAASEEGAPDPATLCSAPDVEGGTFTMPRLPLAPTTTGTAEVVSAVVDGSVAEAGWAPPFPAPKPSA